MLELDTPVQYVKGIGPRLAEILAGKGIHTVDDLLHYLPFRYEDRLNPRSINELRVSRPGEAHLALVSPHYPRGSRKPIAGAAGCDSCRSPKAPQPYFSKRRHLESPLAGGGRELRGPSNLPYSRPHSADL